MVLGSLAVLDKDPLCTEEKNQKHTEVLSFSKVCCMCECGGKKTNYNQTENFALGKIKFEAV